MPSLKEKIHRSGSSSSSLSDDGGSRRRREGLGSPKKKGITEKIKEKFPGRYKNEYEAATPGLVVREITSTRSRTSTLQTRDSEKIKDKLPGSHNNEDVLLQETSTRSRTSILLQESRITPEEKKGVVGNVKDKLSGNRQARTSSSSSSTRTPLFMFHRAVQQAAREERTLRKN
uniref:Dehydrin-like protein n=1 Tax=Stellaria longipes TaxID=19744 RepID=Q41347_STELP|nr:dehydrin-like protein [Stellaria longipes]